MSQVYEWAVIGAGPAGIISVGLLLDSGVPAEKLLWIDPDFKVGDFGCYWHEVSSNTRVQLFLDVLQQIQSFHYDRCQENFALHQEDPAGCTQLMNMRDPLQWVTNELMTQLVTRQDEVKSLKAEQGAWQLHLKAGETLQANKVVVATGSTPRTLQHAGVSEIPMDVALTPSVLSQQVSAEDVVAVFGSSHSAMIVVRSLIEAGVKKVVNFYRSPIKFAVPMDGWILYDDTGLKGETARWTHQHITQNLHPKVERHLSDDENIQQYLPECNKAVYAVGFKARTPEAGTLDFSDYDKSNGIIAPGLFGAGIAFPKRVVDPFGNVQFNVGLYKFMNNIQRLLPLWMQYDL